MTDPGPVERSVAGGTTMARLARPRAETETRLGVIADPHVATRATGTSKLFEHTERHLRAAVADAAGRDLDAVVSVGDLTKDGEPWNYDAVDDALGALEAPFHAIPGNHDVPKAGDEHDTPPVAEFASRYAPGELPFHVEVGGVDLIGLNSAGDADRLYDTHDGAVDADQRAWLDGALERAETPVVLVHHNLPPTYDQVRAHRDAVEPEMGIPPTTREAGPLVDVLDGRAPLVLTGHLHMPSAARVGDVREVMAPTTCSFPQAYLLVTVGPGGTTVEFVPVADHDGLREAYRVRSTDSATSRGLTGMAATRLAAFPLVDDR